jgi:hypothetical protein
VRDHRQGVVADGGKLGQKVCKRFRNSTSEGYVTVGKLVGHEGSDDSTDEDEDNCDGTFEHDLKKSMHIAMLYKQEDFGDLRRTQTCAQIDRHPPSIFTHQIQILPQH